MNPATQIYQETMSMWAPPPRLTISQWADHYRVLSPESAAEPGKWHTSRAEYQRGIMDALNNPAIETVVIMSSAQVGKTEIINNIAGYFISQDPAPILIIQPTLEMAQTWSKDRFAPMVRDTATLTDLIKNPRSRDSNNTILHKVFPGGHITVAGANSAAGLASRPIRVVLCDEIDRYPASAGSEGDPVSLAVKRAKNFWNRKIVLVSTPTIKGLSRIEAAFNESDRRYYFVPCHACQKEQVMVWGNVRWEKAADGGHLPETARYHCEYCQAAWSEAQRLQAVRKGRWVAEKPGGKIAGFHISELYSPWGKLPAIVDDFLKSKTNRERLMVWVNTVLGEPFEDAGDRLEWQVLYTRREYYPAEVPAGALVLVASTDVQDDRLETSVWGFGLDDESWLIEHHIIPGNLARQECWNSLDEFLKKTYIHESGVNLRISAATVDSGGHFTAQVYRFCRGKEDRRIYATKGGSTAGLPLISRPRTSNKGKVPLVTIGTDTAKQIIHNRLRIEDPGPGYIHFPVNQYVDEEFFQQLTAEKAVTKYHNGFPYRVWVKTRPRNEALDCLVGALAAVAMLNPNYKKIANYMAEIGEKAETPKEAEPRSRKKKGWAQKWQQ